MAEADFKIWNNKEKTGGSTSYIDAQGQSGILNTNSLETYDDTWVIIFSKNNYDEDNDGDYKLLNPNTYLDHLKEEDRDSGGNWKNNLKSFILYKTKPSWWNSGVRPTYNELFTQPEGRVLFTKDPNYLDDNRVFTAPFTAVNLLNENYTSSGRRMDDEYDPGNVSAINSGANTWLIIFDKSASTGNFYKIKPNSPLPNLGGLDRMDMDGNRQGDWANDISSFLLYDAKPIFWDTDYPGPYLDLQNFCDAYPNGTLSGNEVDYIIANNTYKINKSGSLQSATQTLPAYHGSIDMDNLPEDGWTSFYITLEHHNTAGLNDTSSFYLIFDNNSKLIDIQVFTWHSADGAYSISEAVIATVDLDLEMLGDETAIETCGVSIVVANVLASVFDTVCGVFNNVAASMFQKNDDGGRYYFLPVICHTINRVSSTVFSNYGIPPYTSDDDPRANMTLGFNYSGFKNALNVADNNFTTIQDWAVDSDANGTSPNNKVMEMTYQKYYNFKTWYIETSLTQSLGMLVSAKIDYEVESGDNNHIILMAGFTMPASGSTEPILAFAQAMIQFPDDSDQNIMSDMYSSGDIVNDIYTDLQGQLNQLNLSSDQGNTYLADIATANLKAMVTCVVTESIS